MSQGSWIPFRTSLAGMRKRSSPGAIGADVKTLAAIEKLSRDIKSLEETAPLTDPSPIKFYARPAPAVEAATETAETV